MSTHSVLRLSVFVVWGGAALVLVLGGCASYGKDMEAAGGAIPHSINKDLTRGFSLAEDQRLTARDREIYEAERHNDVYPEHKGTLGKYDTIPGEEGRLWHWSKD